MTDVYKRIPGDPTAATIDYDNSASGLTATTVQGAIDEVAADIASGIPASAQVNTFADLPAPASVPGEFRYVTQDTGSYLLFNRRKRGWYQSDGAQWLYAGDNTRNASDAFYDSSANSLTSNNVQGAIDETEVRVAAAEGTIATALQPGDNISQLTNDAGYLDEAAHDALPQDNPHGVTAAQVGADPAGTATAAIAAHEAAADPHPQYVLDSAVSTVGLTNDYNDLDNLPTLGTAASADKTDFATAAQGTLAASATQPGDNVSTLTNDAGYITLGDVPGDAVTSVNGQTGVVVLDTDDVAEATNLYYTDARVAAAPSVTANAASSSANATAIAGNTANIGANTGAIAANSTNITANAGNIATNVTAIANNDTDIATLQARLDIVETVYEVFEAGTTGSAAAPTIVDMDTERFATAGFTLAGGQVTVANAGRYEISYSLSTNSTNNTRAECLVDLYQNGAIVPGSRAFTYNRNVAAGEGSAAKKVVLDLGAGDVIDIRFNTIAGTAGAHPTSSSASNIVFRRILEWYWRLSKILPLRL